MSVIQVNGDIITYAYKDVARISPKIYATLRHDFISFIEGLKDKGIEEESDDENFLLTESTAKEILKRFENVACSTGLVTIEEIISILDEATNESVE
jgi:hypothetical protein